MKKNWLLRLGLFAGVAVLGFLLIAWWTRHQPEFEQFTKIRAGMTIDEVNEILGVPPGDYGYGETFPFESLKRIYDPKLTKREWLSQEQKITVFFDEDVRVSRTKSERVVRRMSVTDLFRRVLRIR